MRRPLATLCLILLVFPAVASRIVAQEPASEADRALLAAAAANLEAAESWHANFTLTLLLDGILEVEGLALDGQTSVLQADGILHYGEGGAAFAFEARLVISLRELFPEGPVDPIEARMALVLAEDELRIVLESGGERIQETVPLDTEALVGWYKDWEVRLSAELAEFGMTFEALVAEHGELWRLSDRAGHTVLQAALDGRQVLLDPGFTVPLVKLILNLLNDLVENSAGLAEMPLNIGPLELGIALGFVFTLIEVEEAEVKTTYVLAAEREELQAVELEAELILNLAALGLLEATGLLRDAEAGELRLRLIGKARLIDYGAALPADTAP